MVGFFASWLGWLELEQVESAGTTGVPVLWVLAAWLVARLCTGCLHYYDSSLVLFVSCLSVNSCLWLLSLVLSSSCTVLCPMSLVLTLDSESKINELDDASREPTQSAIKFSFNFKFLQLYY